MTTQCDIIYQTLKDAAGAWVPMPRLVELSGSYNVHSRIDELRHKRGIAIENQTLPDPKRPRRRISLYRLPI